MATIPPAPTSPPQSPNAGEENSGSDSESSPNTIVQLDSKGEHLLQSPWTFWFARKIPKTQLPVNYAEHLQKIASFNTVEEFYRTYVYIARPLELPKDSNFHMFKGDVVPMWESFPNGGCWIIKLNKKSTQLALLWEELLVYTIGEVFEEPDIVGVVLSVRPKEHILAVWNGDSHDPILRTRVCEKLKYYLRLEPDAPIEYKPNSTSMRDKSTYRNGKIVVPTKDKKKKKKKGNKQPQQQLPTAVADGSSSSVSLSSTITPSPSTITPSPSTITPSPSSPSSTPIASTPPTKDVPANA